MGPIRGIKSGLEMLSLLTTGRPLLHWPRPFLRSSQQEQFLAGTQLATRYSNEILTSLVTNKVSTSNIHDFTCVPLLAAERVMERDIVVRTR